MSKHIKILFLGGLIAFSGLVAKAQSENISKAIELYENGLYSESIRLFEAEESLDAISTAYSTLCELKLRTPLCKSKYQYYKTFYTDCRLTPIMDYTYAEILYDEGNYQECLDILEHLKIRTLTKDYEEDYYFYKAQCYYETKNYDAAFDAFIRINASDRYDRYKAQAAYCLGYMYYKKEDFAASEKYFEKIVEHSRFHDVAAYYIVECRFMQKDYKYVVENGPKMFDNVPGERQARFARIISESYMLTGNLSAANEYFLKTDTSAISSDNDFYYAGSILYALKDYKGAAYNFSQIRQEHTLLAQQAHYNLAYSYINLKNKVAALDQFKAAAAENFDAKIRKDAFINYAKLAFDINKDGSGFREYIKTYPEEAGKEQLYSYMAISYLVSGDYAAAIENYDNIESLDPNESLNYVKANYLRGKELFDAKNFTQCREYFKLAAAFAEEGTELKKRSQYLLADASFLAEQYASAKELYVDLYNNQGLYGLSENSLLSYDIAYCYLSENDYANAEKWFKQFNTSGPKSDAARKRDALRRTADCQFVQKNYSDAASTYLEYNSKYPDLFCVYQAGICYGLLNKNNDKIKALSKVYASDASDPYYYECLFELGRSYETAKKPSDALKSYEAVIKSCPNSNFVAKTLLQAALLMRGKKEYYSAMSYYKRVIEQHSQSEYYKPALSGLEGVYKSQNNPKGYYDYIESLGKIQEQNIQDKDKAIFHACEEMYQSDNFAGALEAFTTFVDSHAAEDTIKVQSQYYIAVCLEKLGRKEKAIAAYKTVMDAGLDLRKQEASESYASLSYSLQNWEDALLGYNMLAQYDPSSLKALLGVSSSLYKLGRYDEAIKPLEELITLTTVSPEIIHQANYMLAKSYLATSQRDKAKERYEILAQDIKTKEGAEAAVFLIEDLYFTGDFEAVEKRVFDFADSGCGDVYYLAKAYIILGDSYAEMGRMKEAKATFESIKAGYHGEDDILSEVQMRLNKIAD